MTPASATPVRKEPAVSPPGRPFALALLVAALAIVALIALLFGLITSLTATTVMHQILGALHFLTFTVALAGIAVIVAASPSAKLP